jgi:hypothetical protein
LDYPGITRGFINTDFDTYQATFHDWMANVSYNKERPYVFPNILLSSDYWIPYCFFNTERFKSSLTVLLITSLQKHSGVFGLKSDMIVYDDFHTHAVRGQEQRSFHFKLR